MQKTVNVDVRHSLWVILHLTVTYSPELKGSFHPSCSVGPLTNLKTLLLAAAATRASQLNFSLGQ